MISARNICSHNITMESKIIVENRKFKCKTVDIFSLRYIMS